jgi:hypothetical protein
MANIGRNQACPCGSSKVTWSHRFTIRKDFRVTDYADRRHTVFGDYPAARIRTLLSRACSSRPPEVLANIHIDQRSNPVN